MQTGDVEQLLSRLLARKRIRDDANDDDRCKDKDGVNNNNLIDIIITKSDGDDDTDCDIDDDDECGGRNDGERQTYFRNITP